MTPSETELLEKWQKAWPEALALWSLYTRLSEPAWAFSVEQEKQLGMPDSFAAIRLKDHRVMISLRSIAELHLQDYAPEILAHEIGHHVFCPGNLVEMGQSLALAIYALPGHESQAPMIVNMWEDLLINDRLVRLHKQRHAEIYEAINRRSLDAPTPLWNLYMKTFEILWGLEPGRLCKETLKPWVLGDAHLAARMVRVYGQDWMLGVGGFAALCLPYLEKSKLKTDARLTLLFDTQSLGEGCDVPLGIMDLGDFKIVHPSQDPRLAESGPGAEGEGESQSSEGQGMSGSDDIGGSLGQNRQPFVFGQVLEALGMKLDAHDAAAKYYREKALPHLINFPTQEHEHSKEPLMEGLEPWDVGNPTEEIDWLESVMFSPLVIPGVTTLRRSWGDMGGVERKREPLDLDLYVDCSGSIPNPQKTHSFLTLAGAIVVLSAFRTGAKVQATLWSGPGEFVTTPGFVSDERAVLRVLTGYLGGSTAFPNHILRETFQDRKATDRPVHILILSDEGIDTMAYLDEKKTPGMEIAKSALEKARGGGTMVLNLWRLDFLQGTFATAAKKMGWELFPVKDWSDLIQFAREFSRLKYGKGRQKASRNQAP